MIYLFLCLLTIFMCRLFTGQNAIFGVQVDWIGQHTVLAEPVIHQACHQIMFINYMPFLFLSLIGIDRHFDKRKSILYLLGVFLIIIISFYFSIGRMLALILYGIYRCFEITPKFHLLTFLKDGVRFLFPILTTICMSRILLIPTFLALFGRKQHSTAVTTSLRELLIPQFPPLRVAYNTYGLGLTTLAITVLIVRLTYRKRSERLLNLGCLAVITIPLFAWILNDGLYIRGKAVIPFFTTGLLPDCLISPQK